MTHDQTEKYVDDVNLKGAFDPVCHPSYYTDGKIEVIRYIHDKKLGFNLGNAIKYISRAGKKNKDTYIEDLKKAIWYLENEITEYVSDHQKY